MEPGRQPTQNIIRCFEAKLGDHLKRLAAKGQPRPLITSQFYQDIGSQLSAAVATCEGLGLCPAGEFDVVLKPFNQAVAESKQVGDRLLIALLHQPTGRVARVGIVVKWRSSDGRRDDKGS